MNKTPIQIVKFAPNRRPEVVSIPPTLGMMQEVVDGPIEFWPYSCSDLPDITFIVCEEGLLHPERYKERYVPVFNEMVSGTFFATRLNDDEEDEDNEFQTLNEADIKKILDVFSEE